jgi:hypothetical protein
MSLQLACRLKGFNSSLFNNSLDTRTHPPAGSSIRSLRGVVR